MTRRVLPWALSLWLSLPLATAVPAQEEPTSPTPPPTTLPCPIGGETGATVTLDPRPPPRQIGLRMDLRPISSDPTRQLPLPLLECEPNGMVLFQDQFTAEEAAALTPLLASAFYRQLRDAGHARGFRAAWLLEQMGEDDADTLAYYLMLGAWEVEGRDPSLYRDYVLRAVAAFSDGLDADKSAGEHQFTQLLIANLLRRAGQEQEAILMIAQVPEADPLLPPSVAAYRARLADALAQKATGPRTFLRDR